MSLDLKLPKLAFLVYAMAAILKMAFFGVFHAFLEIHHAFNRKSTLDMTYNNPQTPRENLFPGMY